MFISFTVGWDGKYSKAKDVNLSLKDKYLRNLILTVYRLTYEFTKRFRSDRF